MRKDGFYMPARVICGDDAVRKHAKEIGKYGSKALIVTGRHSADACGVYEDICAALEESGTAYCRFSDVEPNPSVQTIMKARDYGLEQGADFVIGAGGGSPMDAAKAIALMISHAEEGADYLYTAGADGGTVPVICIPTTCGTGSEVTGVSVLSNDKLKTKKSIPFKIFPDLSLIDGKYLMYADRKTLCNTGFDALAHLYESYINSSATPMSRMIAEDGMRVWKDNLPVLLGEKELDAASAESLMKAAMLGGMAIAHTGTSLPHGLSYALTYNLGVPHGQAVCFFMTGYLESADPEDAAHALELSGFENAAQFGDAYKKCCGLPEVSEEALRSTLDACTADLAADPAKCAKAPFAVDGELLKKIAYRSLDIL